MIPTIDELTELETAVRNALMTRDDTALNILGFGEISVALGWPVSEPRLVCKRMPEFSEAQFEQYERLMGRYLDALAEIGITAVTTTVTSPHRSGRRVVYLVQPLVPAETLGDKVLGEAAPDAEHPMLVALGETISLVTPALSVDAQVSNWSWSGTELTLLDVGTPFVWDESGRLVFDMTPFLAMVPAPVRPLVRRDLTRLVSRWQSPRGVAADVVANLYRAGLDQWVDPALDSLNRAIGPAERITATEARALYDEDVKTWPRLKKLQQIERAWQTSLRRRRYDFFIQSSFTATTD